MAGTRAFLPTIQRSRDRNALYMALTISSVLPWPRHPAAAFVVNKASLLTGGPIIVTSFRHLERRDGFGNGIWNPSRRGNDDPAATEGYFIGVDSFTSGKLNILRVSDPGGTPTLSQMLSITVPSTAHPIPQAHRGDTLNKNSIPLTIASLPPPFSKTNLPALTLSGPLTTSKLIRMVLASSAVIAMARAGMKSATSPELPRLFQSGTLFDSASVNPRGVLDAKRCDGPARATWVLGLQYAASNVFSGLPLRPLSHRPSRLDSISHFGRPLDYLLQRG